MKLHKGIRKYFRKWLRGLARRTLSDVERKVYVEAIQDREAIIRKKNAHIAGLYQSRYMVRKELRRVKDAFQSEYERLIYMFGSFEAARAYCEMEGVPAGLMDWFQEAEERWGNAEWWNEVDAQREGVEE